MSDATPRSFHVKDAASRAKIAGTILKLPVDKPWDITIKRYVRPRTLKQNARLHLLLSLVAEEVGDTIDNVKLGYKALFLTPKVVKLKRPARGVCECCGQSVRGGDGSNVRIYPSTAKMNVQELNRFMTLVELHAIENFGIVLGDGP